MGLSVYPQGSPCTQQAVYHRNTAHEYGILPGLVPVFEVNTGCLSQMLSALLLFLSLSYVHVRILSTCKKASYSYELESQASVSYHVEAGNLNPRFSSRVLLTAKQCLSF